ncbi:MAG: MBL fold metallo-hydrolase [Treponema sp.]|jgi:glyoxylase-like metal-dependent hydrolase (beta-lactamase superfamily II)|nr:MBL fold metallo-hydrolase [Treponema sp.]
MKLFFHYCLKSFANCYVLGSDFPDVDKTASPAEDGTGTVPRDALIIDPGSMDEALLNFIEKSDYTLRGILITHDHRSHVQGLRTLKRIYDVDIYAVNHIIQDHRTNLVKDGDTRRIGPFTVEVISVPGHSADSAVFKIDRLLFTGDALTAGLVGSTVNSYGTTVQMTALRSKIFSLPGDFTILPGHGPPSTLDVERRFNAGVEFYEESSRQPPQFTVHLFDQE